MKKKHKNELEKSVTPPYVALLFAKKPQKIIALHYFYYYKDFQKKTPTLLWKKIWNTGALSINEAELCFKEMSTIILAFIKNVLSSFNAVY